MQSTKPSTLAEKLKVPLVVGITGHKDIVNQEDVRAKLKLFWETIRKLAGDDTPVFLLTSIASGADHLATEFCRENDIPYCVVLPFDKEEYRKTFAEEDRTDFDDDWDGRYKEITCNARPGDYGVASNYVRKHCDVLLTMWDGWETLEDEQPGVRDRKSRKGGTYYQLRSAFGMDDLLQHHPEKKHLVVNIKVDRSQKGPAFHREHGEAQIWDFSGQSGLSVLSCNAAEQTIFASADFSEWAANFLRRNEAGRSGRSYATDGMIEDFPDVLEFIRFHNAQARATAPKLREGTEAYYLRKNDAWKTPDGQRALSIVANDFDRHDYCDSIAGRHQRAHEKQFLWIAVWSLIVGLLGQVWGDVALDFLEDEVFAEKIIHYGIYLYLSGCFGLALYSILLRKNDHYSRYIKPRIIAELLRVRIFWTLAGIPGSFTDHLLEENTDNVFALLLCNWEVAEPPLSNEDRELIERGDAMAVVKSCWLEDQLYYYESYLLPDRKPASSPRQAAESKAVSGAEAGKEKFSLAWLQGRLKAVKNYFRKYERLERLFTFTKKFCFWAGFVSAAVLLLIFVFAREYPQGLKIGRELMVGIFPFLVASLGWLLEKKEWGSIARQYRVAHDLFRKTIDYVDDPNHDMASKRQIIREMMIFAHEENAEWNSIKKDAKPEPMW